MTRPALKSVRNFALAAFALALAPACLRAYKITGQSEAPTLVLGDRILVNRVAYLFDAPQRGEMWCCIFLTGRSSDRKGGTAFRATRSKWPTIA